MSELTIIDAMNNKRLFGRWFKGASWDGWRAVLKATAALPMSDDEVAFFRQVAERDPPKKPVRRAAFICGRRAGKDSIASLISAHAAISFDGSGLLRPGEKAHVMSFAVDRDQSRIQLDYCRGFYQGIPFLKDKVERETKDGFELSNCVNITIATSDFRSLRGRSVLNAVISEAAFLRDESTSGSPDIELFRAIEPGCATLDGSILTISSPYKRSGLLWELYKDHYGRNSDTLVIKAPTRVMNPLIDPRIIDAALEKDPAAAGAEWLAEFRSDVASFIDPTVVDTAVIPGRHELPRVDGVSYVGFVDPSGGSSDSMTLAIAHAEGDRAVLDLVREVKPPFSPDNVAREFGDTLYSYGIRTVRGDRYGGMWPRERFAAHGIEYQPATKTKSDYYLAALPLLNAGRLVLLDNDRLKTQLANLERRTARGGRDSVDHPPRQHDDVVNSALACLVNASDGSRHEYGYGKSYISVERAPWITDELDWDQIRARVATVKNEDLPPELRQ